MKKKITLLITALFCFSLFVSPVYAASEAELQKQKQDAVAKINAAQYKIDMSKNTIEDIEAEIVKANTEIAKTTGQVDALNGKINELDANLETLKADLAAAEAKQAQHGEELRERLRVMYMYGNDGYMSVLFSATDFADFITKADMVKSIAKADRNSAIVLENAAKEVNAKKTAIEDNRAGVEVAKAEQEAVLTTQESIKSQKDELLSKNQVVVEKAKEDLKKEEAAYAQADNQLAAIISAREEEAQRLLEEKRKEEQEAAGGGNSGGGNTGGETGGGSTEGGGSQPTPTPTPPPAPSQGLIWPISSAYYPDEWDDMFGNRIHPIWGTWTWHSGADMGAPYGTPVYAPGDGIVTMAGENGGYGNCITIRVDGGTVLFGHLSSMNVSDGEFVRQGQVVGGVGSTGNSTGNHLHLGFIVNGNYVDPLNYMHW
ncbi:MAG: peptidoglycan DD-metalloendopeptidase family protein [Eubacterium sp.]